MGTEIRLLFDGHIFRFAIGDEMHPTTLCNSLTRPF